MIFYFKEIALLGFWAFVAILAWFLVVVSGMAAVSTIRDKIKAYRRRGHLRPGRFAKE